jgi:chemosensory pili system protein ChpA (sensor histidine kinase/response regulator)
VADQSGSVKAVLIVTDDPKVREELRFGFSADTEVVIAEDARDAWAQMADTVPTAAIVDLQTGSAGGYGLARDMSADARLANVPVILLLQRPQDAWLAKQAGAAGYLVKPVTVAAVTRLMTNTAQRA